MGIFLRMGLLPGGFFPFLLMKVAGFRLNSFYISWASVMHVLSESLCCAAHYRNLGNVYAHFREYAAFPEVDDKAVIPATRKGPISACA